MARWKGTALIVLWTSGIASGPWIQDLEGQDLGELARICGGGVEVVAARCQEAALAVQAAQGALGLAATGGADIPGSASTLGWRLKGSPRIAISFRGSVTRASLLSPGTIASGGAHEVLGSMLITGAVGVFDGFSLGPTMGGFGSLDLTLFAHHVWTPGNGGFGKNMTGWGVGGRLGILRESFNLPGISLSAAYRFLGDSHLWDVAAGDAFGGEFDLKVKALRGIVGKDIQGIGFFAGLGWDRYDGDIALVVTDPEAEERRTLGELRSDRRLYFAGASMTFLALQISAELGVADGFDPRLSPSVQSGFDPSARSEFGSLSLRLTF